MMRKKMTAILLCVLMLMCFCGCEGEKKPETPATMLAWMLDDYLDDLDLAEQQDLFWDYYNYYAEESVVGYEMSHQNELRFLPDFAEGEQPSWDNAFIFLMDFADIWRNEEGYVCWPQSGLEAAADKLLPDYIIPEESNGWVDYHAEDGGYFQSVGWSIGGAVYYWLTVPVQLADGVYQAEFFGYALDEVWYDTVDFGPAVSNEAKLCQIALDAGVEPIKFDLQMHLPEILQAGQLTPCEKLTVSFKLSGDDKLPLTYLSAERVQLTAN